ncbi:hypothetical protein CL634_11490 [bacterium]|nr:hypothetical protein [bacterium]
MPHKLSDGDSCKNYFKHGKSFPDNVRDAICDIDEAVGGTGPTGPAGPSGKAGGVIDPATVENILAGVNGTPDPTYVDPSGWYASSNQYSPLVDTRNVTNGVFTPNALDTNIFDVTHSGDCTIASPVNMKNGRTITIVLRQAGPGNNTIHWDPMYHFDGGYNQITYTQYAKDVMVGTKVNDFVFSTIATDVKPGV